MKKLFILSFLLIISESFVNAQVSHDLEIFSEDGLLFTLFVNGEKINAQPESRVKITNTENDMVQIKIIFQDTSIATIEKKYLQIAAPTNTQTKSPVSTVYKIHVKKGIYKLKFASRSPKKFQEKVIIIN